MAEDTISAVTTALGEGAVGIVRISDKRRWRWVRPCLRRPPARHWVHIR